MMVTDGSSQIKIEDLFIFHILSSIFQILYNRPIIEVFIKKLIKSGEKGIDTR